MTASDPGSGPGSDPYAAAEPTSGSGYRTYEVYQRERVGESTNLLRPKELLADEMLDDPYRLLTILREHYPCYRDWVGNRFWITRYDDVTSVFTDDANYETRSRRWTYGRPDLGRDLRADPAIEQVTADRLDASIDAVVERVIDDLRAGDTTDLATAFAARLPIELWGEVLGLPTATLPDFARAAWRMRRGAGWNDARRVDGLAAFAEMAAMFDPLISARRSAPGDDLLSVAATLDLHDGPITGADVAATVLESDHDTLHGGIANLWFLLLTHPDQLAVVRDDPRLMKFAWLETLRHSPPVMEADRYARHEVERFGRLLPAGALLHCSAGAANRDPRVFADPDEFVVGRTDLCQREPRGQYRADGLASGITLGLGRPTIHPAVPKDRPRSAYALTRDIAVTASQALLDAMPTLRLADGAQPRLRSSSHGEMRTCWSLPVVTREPT